MAEKTLLEQILAAGPAVAMLTRATTANGPEEASYGRQEREVAEDGVNPN